MRNLFDRIRLYLSNIGEVGGMSLPDVSFAITATVLVGAIVVTSGAGVINDTEEKAHFLNAIALGTTARIIAMDERLPANYSKIYSLADLQLQGKIDEAIDPTTEEPYGSDTKVTVFSLRANGYANPMYGVLVKLTNNDNSWTYFDTAISGEIKIPARHAEGISNTDAIALGDIVFGDNSTGDIVFGDNSTGAIALGDNSTGAIALGETATATLAPSDTQLSSDLNTGAVTVPISDTSGQIVEAPDTLFIPQ